MDLQKQFSAAVEQRDEILRKLDSRPSLCLPDYRFDPNDFILTDQGRTEKIGAIRKWLEGSSSIGAIWDGLTPMERELETSMEKKELSWDFYLDQILSLNCQVRKRLQQLSSVYQGVHLQHVIRALQRISGQETIAKTIETLYPEIAGGEESALANEIRKEIDPILKPIQSNKDKLLFLDLLRLLAPEDHFSTPALEEAKKLSPAKYRKLCQSFLKVKKEVKHRVKTLYHQRIFPRWRKRHFKAYLKEKREEEKRRKTYAHPYTDYLEEGEKKLFAQFWKEHEWSFFDAFINVFR